MASFTVIYDANVLYPAPLRSILMFLAQVDLFRARWTMDIHEEWIRNLLLKRPGSEPGKTGRASGHDDPRHSGFAGYRV
jgi:hypothetical protein